MENPNRYLYGLAVLSVFIISGCVVRTYPLTRDRVDQNLSDGNRGFLTGSTGGLGQTGQVQEKKSKRTTQIFEIELAPFIKFEKMQPQDESGAQAKAAGDNESVDQPRQDSEDLRQRWLERSSYETGDMVDARPAFESLTSESYTVRSGDTLQKISQQFYGTTRRWQKIFNANKEVLKGSERIYPGQVISIPAEGIVAEPKENLK